MTNTYGDPGHTALYRLFDAAGELLYVGIATHPKARWQQHAAEKSWWHLVAEKAVVWFATRAEALAEEERATQDERPRYDQSYRLGKGGGLPRKRFDDSDGKARVRAHVTAAIEAGAYKPGDSIKVTRIARELGVAPITAKSVFWTLQEERRVAVRGGGYYKVLPAQA